MQSESPKKFNTSLSTKKVTYEWEIKEWNAVAKVGELKTDSFTLPDVNKACFFQINASPTCRLDYDLKIYTTPFQPSERCWVIFSYITNGERKAASHSTHHLENSVSCYSCSRRIGVQNNPLTMMFEIFYILDNTSIEKSIQKTMLCNNLNNLYKSKKLFDVTILVRNKKFQAHAAALANVSTYFLAMFENDNFVESRSRVVDLTKDVDITVQNFHGFLEYIYGNKSILELKNIVSELLILADKFDVKLLHEACELFISENISQENIIKILILSDKYRCQILKKKAIIFAKNNIDIIKRSEEFKDLFKNVDIVRELL